MRFERELSAAQKRALAKLEEEHGLVDAMSAKRGKPAFADFHVLGPDMSAYRCFRIDVDGSVEDVTQAILNGPGGAR